MSDFIRSWWKLLLLAIVVLAAFWIETHVKHSQPTPGSIPPPSQTVPSTGPGSGAPR